MGRDLAPGVLKRIQWVVLINSKEREKTASHDLKVAKRSEPCDSFINVLSAPCENIGYMFGKRGVERI